MQDKKSFYKQISILYQGGSVLSQSREKEPPYKMFENYVSQRKKIQIEQTLSENSLLFSHTQLNIILNRKKETILFSMCFYHKKHENNIKSKILFSLKNTQKTYILQFSKNNFYYLLYYNSKLCVYVCMTCHALVCETRRRYKDSDWPYTHRNRPQ